MEDNNEVQEQAVEEVTGTVELGLTADNLADMKAITAEDEPKVEPEVKEIDEKEDKMLDRLAKLEEKLEKTQASSQSRIDQLTAEKKQLAEDLAELRAKSKEAEPDPVDKLVETRDRLLKEKKRIKKAIYEAQVDGETEKYDHLIDEETKVDLSILRLDKEYDKLEVEKESVKTSKAIVEKQHEWDRSLLKAIAKFPDLKTEDGKLNTDSVLWKEAAKLMMSDTRKPKNFTFLDRLNPSYDHIEGPYNAIIEAYLALNTNKSDKKVKAVERENNELKAKEQLLTQTMATADRTDTSAKRRATALQAVIDGGENTAGADDFLRLENKRLGLTK